MSTDNPTFGCPLLENCPSVLAACERKVQAEAKSRLLATQVATLEGRIEAYEADLADYSAKRAAMNELFASGVAMRKAQRNYFAVRTHENLVASKAEEARFDRAIQSCKSAGKPVQKEFENV